MRCKIRVSITKETSPGDSEIRAFDIGVITVEKCVVGKSIVSIHLEKEEASENSTKARRGRH